MTTILVEGTLSNWLWNGSAYYQGNLIDPGIFAAAGTSLTGDPIQILWNDDGGVTATITIDGATVTLGPAQGFYAAYAQVGPSYQNITVCNCWHNLAVNSYDPLYAATHNPHGLGGSLELCLPLDCSPGSIALDGYFYITSMIDPANSPALPVPAPVAGSGALGAALLVAFVVDRLRRRVV